MKRTNKKHSIWMKQHKITPPSRKGVLLSEETKDKIRKNANPWNRGKKMSLESRNKMSEAKKRNPIRYLAGKKRPDIAENQKGEKNRMWMGGISSLNQKIRNSNDYKEWRKLVLKRDKKCVLCGSIEKLRADHIKPQSLYPELRFEIENGRTLCFKCDILQDTFGGKIKRLRKASGVTNV